MIASRIDALFCWGEMKPEHKKNHWKILAKVNNLEAFIKIVTPISIEQSMVMANVTQSQLEYLQGQDFVLAMEIGRTIGPRKNPGEKINSDGRRRFSSKRLNYYVILDEKLFSILLLENLQPLLGMRILMPMMLVHFYNKMEIGKYKSNLNLVKNMDVILKTAKIVGKLSKLDRRHC